jgi:hypothetical protein
MVVESPSGEYYWDCIGDITGRWPFGRWKIGPEAVADAFMERTYKAALVWEPTDGSAYPTQIIGQSSRMATHAVYAARRNQKCPES